MQTEAKGPSVYARDAIGALIHASLAALDADADPGVQEGRDDIGDVNDIVLGRDGSVDAVPVDIGGFLGFGERQVAVDMAALWIVQDDATDAHDRFRVLQTDRARLEAAPECVRPGAVVDGDAAATTGTAPAEAPYAATDIATTEPAGDAATDTMATEGAATDGATVAKPRGLPEGYTQVTREELTAEKLTGANEHDPDDA